MEDTIVIGSGIGGLAAAAALARHGRRVLVLEQHDPAGGLTQTFQRGEWNFSPGVHYIGGGGPHGHFARLLAWLAGGALHFSACANPYDIVHLPGFTFGIPHPESAYRAALLERFPQEQAVIDRWFASCEAARGSALAAFAQRGVPAFLGWAVNAWCGTEAERWARRTLAAELEDVANPKLRAVLGARWADYGATPEQAPFLEHALVTGSYNGGAWYPVGGPGRFAQALVPVVQAHGGEVRLGCDAKRILAVNGRTAGVEYVRDGRLYRELADSVVSAMGVANTVACLDPEVAASWQATVRVMHSGLAAVSMYLGLEGDIAAAGASSANHWFYETEDIGAVWSHPADEDAPGLFVSFPSLKDPACAGKPTAEVVAAVDGSVFAPWLAQPPARGPASYSALKALIGQRMLGRFLHHFPDLRPMLRFHEVSTPATQQRYVRAPGGAMYGLEMSARRLQTPALRVRTPLPGLLLAGQDVTSPGVEGALMGGLLAAAALEPLVWARLRPG